MLVTLKIQRPSQLRLCHINLLFLMILLWCIFVFIFTVYIFKEDDVEIDPIFKRGGNSTTKSLYLKHNISCHYENDGDELPSVGDPSFSPKDKSIFMIESMCLGDLTELQACAVESAARAHPHWEIYVLFTSPVKNFSLYQGFLPLLLQYKNVKLARIHVTEYFKDTILKSIVTHKVVKSEHPIEDFSQLLRIVTLNKWGGIFLDKNMIVFKSLDKLPKNWLAKLDQGVSSSILSFGKDEVGRKFTNEIMKEISRTYDPKSWQFNGLEAITRVLNRICPKVLKAKSKDCHGLTVFSRELFYPIQYTSKIFYIENYEVDVGKMKVPYTYHHLLNTWDYNSYEFDEDWPFDAIALKFCPNVYGISK